MGFLKKMLKKSVGLDPISKRVMKKDPVAKKVLASPMGKRMAKLSPGLSTAAKGMRTGGNTPAVQAPGKPKKVKYGGGGAMRNALLSARQRMK